MVGTGDSGRREAVTGRGGTVVHNMRHDDKLINQSILQYVLQIVKKAFNRSNYMAITERHALQNSEMNQTSLAESNQRFVLDL